MRLVLVSYYIMKKGDKIYIGGQKSSFDASMTAGSGPVNTIQVKRKSKNKDIATLYDIADDLSYGSHHNYTLDHFEERLKIYKEENFSMAKYKVQLKT